MADKDIEKKPTVLALTKSERIMFQGIQAREREVEREVLKPLRADLQEVLQGIHERLGLEPGAIGRTHQLDIESWTVQKLPDPPADPPYITPCRQITGTWI